jgi:phosphatidylglycerophosphatase C
MALALFDFDGTITIRETMPDFIRIATRPFRLLLGKILLLPIIVGYKAGFVSGSVARASICRFCFWQIPISEVEVHGERFARTVLPNLLRQRAMDRIAWHKARGDTVVVVSGGLDLYLSFWCREHNLELLCSKLQMQRGVLTGRYLGSQCVRAEKARLVQERFPPGNYSRVFAYGDTPEDRELLALADEPFYRWQPLSGAEAVER